MPSPREPPDAALCPQGQHPAGWAGRTLPQRGQTRELGGQLPSAHQEQGPTTPASPVPLSPQRAADSAPTDQPPLQRPSETAGIPHPSRESRSLPRPEQHQLGRGHLHAPAASPARPPAAASRTAGWNGPQTPLRDAPSAREGPRDRSGTRWPGPTPPGRDRADPAELLPPPRSRGAGRTAGTGSHVRAARRAPRPPPRTLSRARGTPAAARPGDPAPTPQTGGSRRRHTALRRRAAAGALGKAGPGPSAETHRRGRRRRLRAPGQMRAPAPQGGFPQAQPGAPETKGPRGGRSPRGHGAGRPAGPPRGNKAPPDLQGRTGAGGGRRVTRGRPLLAAAPRPAAARRSGLPAGAPPLRPRPAPTAAPGLAPSAPGPPPPRLRFPARRPSAPLPGRAPRVRSSRLLRLRHWRRQWPRSLQRLRRRGRQQHRLPLADAPGPALYKQDGRRLGGLGASQIRFGAAGDNQSEAAVVRDVTRRRSQTPEPHANTGA